MTDLSLPPLNLTLAPLSEPPPSFATAARNRPGAFSWPTPPFAAYLPAAEQTRPEPCAIEGLNGKTVSGRLMLFMPEQQLANVQVPPARTTLPLQFGQFRSLTLTEPLSPTAARGDDPHAAVLDHRPRSRFRLVFKAGAALEGETVGYVETDFGLFLFPPTGDSGRVTRLFVPAEALASRELGPRVGELLVESHAATPEQVAEAADIQSQLRTQKLGDILVTQRIVTPAQLVAAIEQQSKMPMVRIGEALIALGLITQTELDRALEQQKADRGVPIGELLIRLGCVSRTDLQTALARKMGYPIVDAAAFPMESDALRKLPHPTAKRLGALPLLLRDATLVVAMEDPSRRAAIDEIEFASQCKIAPVLASRSEIEAALPGAYARIGVEVAGGYGSPIDASGFDFEPADAGKLVESLEREGADRVKNENEKPIEQSDNSLVRLIHTMIIEAWNQGVSDIHIENYPGKDKLKIRFRKDGMLRPYLELPHTYRAAIIGRIKIMCDLDISERRKPQDGKINFTKFSAQHRFELRVATIPTNNGLEDVVMRLLTSAKPVAVGKLGLSERHLAQLKTAMERPYGLVLCVGPTGSGKTTTLHSALSHINVPERKIWTAEDPIEITQPGLRQVQVNGKIDWTFAKALRAFLRADPDVIMVGEIRDGETARTAIEASLTGHLVLSTLHTNSAPETVTRLLDMGMDPFNFADALLLVAAQRLVRKLCTECRTSRPITEAECEELLGDHLFVQEAAGSSAAREALRTDWLGRFGKEGRLMHFESPGCPACADTGFRGRHGIHELMPVSREIRRLIQTGARAEELQATALREGMHTLRQDGIEKVLQGMTTIDEVRATSNV
ncbi:MAG: Flp pilus assembly complex ATPase component TadA [Methylibium sp.]|uniref:GspE/PulE family protein n=1 Tax=Methylibium sp. TaxID=2067992 RepID=UPI00181248D6|nr:ATPase, T2SS/T4P/T4SS family [Methylibium sp.]MBA3597383.1 Flp pilus assembly complex ATPase component TadA [Methylibium sp.]